jgi:hypothetical protein
MYLLLLASKDASCGVGVYNLYKSGIIVEYNTNESLIVIADC